MRPLHLILASACSLTLAASACSSSTETATSKGSASSTGGDGGTGGTGGGGDGGTGAVPIVDAGPDADNGTPSDKYPAPHPAPPKVVTLGGPVLNAPKLYSVFFSNDDTAIKTSIKDFASKVGSTAYWKAVTQEYGVGPAIAMPPIELAEAAPTQLTDDAIQQWLAGKINSDDPQFLDPDPDAIFSIYYPVGTSISLQGDKSCLTFGGYHSSVAVDQAHGGGQVAYAVVPRCSDFDGFSGIEAVTAAGSHELVEAATDPYPQVNPAYGQVDNNHIFWLFALGGGETGDMCAQFDGSFVEFPELAYTVQRSWSNKSASAGHDPCVPALANKSYFNSVPVFEDQLTLGGGGQSLKMKGVLIPEGESKTIEVDLFSDGPTSGEWTVEAKDSSDIQGGPKTLDFSWDRDHGVNGEKLHLTIKVLQASQFNAEIFYLVSTLGNQRNIWLGIVGN